jgi:hypothetical protein
MTPTPLFTADKAALAQLAKAAESHGSEEFVLEVGDGSLQATMLDAEGVCAAEWRLGVLSHKLSKSLRALGPGPVAVSADGARIVFEQPGRRLHIGNVDPNDIRSPKFPDSVLDRLSTSMAIEGDGAMDMLRALPDKVRVVLRCSGGKATVSWRNEVDGASFDAGTCDSDAVCGYRSEWLKVALPGATAIRFAPEMPLVAWHPNMRFAVAPWVAIDGDDDE